MPFHVSTSLCGNSTSSPFVIYVRFHSSLRKFTVTYKLPAPCYATISAPGHSVFTEFFKMTSPPRSSNISTEINESLKGINQTLILVTERLAVVEEKSENNK